MRRALVAVVLGVAACRGCERPAPASAQDAAATVTAPDAAETPDAGPEFGAPPAKPRRSTVTYLASEPPGCALYADDLVERHPVRLAAFPQGCASLSYATDEGRSALLWQPKGVATWVRFRPHREETLPPLGNALDPQDYGFIRGAPAALATGPLLPSHPATMMAELEDGGIEEIPVPEGMLRAVGLRFENGQWKVIASRDYEESDDDDGLSDLEAPDLGPRSTFHDFEGIDDREMVENLPPALKARTGRYDEDWFMAWERFTLAGVTLYQKTHRGDPDGSLLWRTARGRIEEVPWCDSVRRLVWRPPWLLCDDQVIDLRRRERVDFEFTGAGLLFVSGND